MDVLLRVLTFVGAGAVPVRYEGNELRAGKAFGR